MSNQDNATFARVSRRARRHPNLVENKFHIVDVNTGTAGSVAGTAVDLSEIAPGTTELLRIGNRIDASSLQVKYFFKANDGAAGLAAGALEEMRLIIFQWGPATSPVGTDILQGATVNPGLREYNVERANEFKILFDSTWAGAKFLASATAPFQENGTTYTQIARYKLPIPNRDVAFTASGSTVGSNKMWLMIYSSTDTAADKIALFMRTKLNFQG